MDCCHCYQVHFGDTVSHAESSALCTSYQALGSILKHKTSHKTDTDNKQGTVLRCAHYITVSLTPMLAAPPTPHPVSWHKRADCRSSSPPMTQCWSLLTSGGWHGGHTPVQSVTVTHTWHYKAVCCLLVFPPQLPVMSCDHASLDRPLQTSRRFSKLFLQETLY